jgi:ABC-type uncharacterized transport system substrate-binding protein
VDFRSLRLTWLRFLAASVAFAALTAPAGAHPHVFPIVTVTALFDDAGRFSGVHEKWSFDYDYSDVVKQSSDDDRDGSVTPEELIKAMGQDGVLSWMPNANYFTRLTFAGRQIPHAQPKDIEAKLFAGKLIIEFTLPVAEPQVVTLGAGIDVFDPEFYYDIEFDYPDVEAPTAPAACEVARREKDNLDPVAVMLIRKLGLTADPKMLSDPAAGYAVRVAIDCK